MPLTNFVSTPIDWIFFGLLVLAAPILAWRKVRSVREKVEAGQGDARLRLYSVAILEQWLFTPVLVFAWLGASRPLADLGLRLPTDGRALLAWGLCLAAVVALALQARAVETSESTREKVREAFRDVSALTPSNRRELRRFSFLSLTAGINEEIVYRGFLMALLGSVGGPLLAVGGSTVVFALGHVYQPRNLPRVAALGLATGLLYWLGGTVLPLMLLHAAIDLTSGWMSWRVAQPPSSAAR